MDPVTRDSPEVRRHGCRASDAPRYGGGIHIRRLGNSKLGQQDEGIKRYLIMKQQTLAMAVDQSESFERYRRPTRRDQLLATMEGSSPGPSCARWSSRNMPRQAAGARRSLERMLRMYLVQHWFNLADEACEEALLDSAWRCGACRDRPGPRAGA